MRRLPALNYFREVNRTFPKTPGHNWFPSSKVKRYSVGFAHMYVRRYIHAAGALPVRITGYSQKSNWRTQRLSLISIIAHSPGVVSRWGCGVSIDYLEGVVAGSTCDGQEGFRFMAALCKRARYSHILTVPRNTQKKLINFYYEQGWASRKFSKNTWYQDYRWKVTTINCCFERIKHYWSSYTNCVKRDKPPITGAETMKCLTQVSVCRKRN